MGRLKVLLNLIVLAIGAFIVWRELTKPEGDRARASSPWEPPSPRPAPAPTPFGSRQPASSPAGATPGAPGAAPASSAGEEADSGITGIVSNVAGMAGATAADDAPAPSEEYAASRAGEAEADDGAAVGETFAAAATGDDSQPERDSDAGDRRSASTGGASAASAASASEARDSERAASTTTGDDRAGGGAAGRGVAASDADAAQPASQAGPRVPPNAVLGDGTSTCPDDHPIKGNATSMIYHAPGRSSYDRTIAEFCFASVEAAESAGFRAPKH